MIKTLLIVGLIVLALMCRDAIGQVTSAVAAALDTFVPKLHKLEKVFLALHAILGFFAFLSLLYLLSKKD